MAHPGDADGSQEEARPKTDEGASTGTPDPSGSTPSPEPRGRIASIPVIDVVLDSRPSSGGPSSHRATLGSKRTLSPEKTALYGLLAGLLVMAAIFGALIGTDHDRLQALFAPFSRTVPSASPTSSTGPPVGSAAPPPATASAVVPPPAIPPAKPIPGPWRLSQLTAAPDVKIVEGAPDRRPVVDALSESGVPRSQVYRLLSAFNGVHKFDKPKRHDSFVVALEVPTRRIRAFEYQVSPTEIYQAKENESGALTGERLDLHVETKRAAAAVVVGDDLSSSLETAGLEPSLVDLLDEALEGRAQLSNLRPGSRLRIVTDYETALGVFAHYLDVLAVEYVSSDATSAPLRVYRFHSDKAQGFFDAKGHQPYKGGFRSPIPFARISSRFNMRRMHPILHVVMPHNGVDFVASTGTPVFAASSGTVETVGDAGPSGNLVTIRHDNGITTGYAHLSRFAPRLARGQPVEARQLIGYVGSTGRSTGAHLHFSAKRNGVFIDPLTLKLDGDRVLPKSDRAEFETLRTSVDKLLDAIPLPSVPADVVHPKSDTEGDDLEPLEDH